MSKKFGIINESRSFPKLTILFEAILEVVVARIDLPLAIGCDSPIEFGYHLIRYFGLTVAGFK
jgi:hypothetical protein